MTYIVIEVVIGVGKTALTRMLGSRLGVAAFFERFEENPISEQRNSIHDHVRARTVCVPFPGKLRLYAAKQHR